MANIKISELTALTPPDAADLVPVTDSNASQTKRTTVGEIVGIVNGDVDVANDGTATISELPVSKLQDGAARQLLQTDAAGTGVEWTSNVDVPGTLDVTGAATLDSTLGVDGQSTLASAAVSDLTADRVVIAGASGELEDSANLTFDGSELGVTGTLDVSSDATVGGDLTVVGDLTVEGATTTLETQTVVIEDKNIELGVVGTPTDTTADGGGITLKGATDKTINWVDATDAWTFSEHVDIASAKEFRIAGTKVLDATTLGSGVVNSSLTSVGTIATGTWQGTAIDTAYLDPTVVTTSDTGTVTSTMILDGTIVNGDINASAAIAGTKIDPDFGSQTVETTGVINAGSGTEEAPAVTVGTADNGLYSPGADQLALATNGAGALFIDSSGNVGIGTAPLTKIDSLVNTFSEDATKIAAGFRNNQNSGVYIAWQNSGTGATYGDGLHIGLGNTANGIINLKESTDLQIATSGIERMRIDSSGRLLVGTSSQAGGSLLQVNDDRIRVASSKTPASASDTGTAGEVCWDSSYIYVCTATDTWKRAALSTW
tara:strand:- start:850 stop:2487 length:1638 start_codon:yes stop_codon:yes gene_type:complete